MFSLDTLVLTSFLGIFVMVLELLNLRKLMIPVVLVSLIGILINHYLNFDFDKLLHFGMLSNDCLSFALIGILLIIGIGIFALSLNKYPTLDYRSDYIVIKVFILAGAIAMVYFQNLIIFFIGLEILSIGFYALVASNKSNVLSNEAAMKYFLMGSFASAIFLLGMTLVYAHTGTFDLALMKTSLLKNTSEIGFLVQAGVFLMIVALLFKAAVAPFHLWSPDVYQGSPMMVTAMLSTLSKVAAIGAFYRLVSFGLQPVVEQFSNLILVIPAILTMLIGSIAAIKQENIKRVLAFSGISNAGFMLIPILNSTHQIATPTILLYLISYAIAGIILFAVAIELSKKTESEQINLFNGLAKDNPFAALSVSVALLSVAGIPPLAGFFAKYKVLVLAFDAQAYVLAIVAILSSVISIYVYFRIIWAMYLKESNQKILLSPMTYLVVFLSAIALVLLGVFNEIIF